LNRWDHESVTKSELNKHHEVTMSNTTKILHRLPLLAGSFAVLLLAAACGGSSTTAAPASSSGASAVAQSGSADVNTAVTKTGKVLVNAKGRTMYAFAADSKGHSNCTDSCLTYWPPVPATAKPPTTTGGVTATFGVLHRQDGTMQLTADGWPMYTYVGDSTPGATSGQGLDDFGGEWWVVAPSGKWITKGDASESSSSKSPAAGRYGGNGY
jgi:predicted lipoprotein with Yx(FWY)xxD motif